jgi:hypothetical protein
MTIEALVSGQPFGVRKRHARQTTPEIPATTGKDAWHLPGDCRPSLRSNREAGGLPGSPFRQRMIHMNKFSGLELEVEKPFRKILLHPITQQPIRDTEGKEAYIDHYSADSEIARKHQRAVQRRRLAMRGRLKITPEELEAEATEVLAALTVGWYLVDFKGQAINTEFTHEHARELYSDPTITWLREQIDESAADRGNFSQGSSTT